MIIFLTGSTGQLGSVLTKELEARGHHVVAPHHSELDICDREAVFEAVNNVHPDAVVNCAAYNQVDRAETDIDSCMRLNVQAVEYLAAAAAAVGAKFMHFSTDYVFDGSGNAPFAEDDVAAPLNIYGRSKADSEATVRRTLDRHFIVRVSWLYSLSGSNFVNTMLRLGQTRSELKVVADQIGSPTYAPRLAGPLADMLESELYGTYNLTSEEFVTWCDFARAIFTRAGMDVNVVPVSSEEYGSAAQRPKNSRLSKKKAAEAGFAPIGAWQEHLDNFFCDKFRENC